MRLDRNPMDNELFAVRCLLTEQVGGRLFGMSETVRKHDYEHLLFRCTTSDETFVIGTPERKSALSGEPQPILLRREDFEFLRVSPEVAKAMGLLQIDEPVFTDEPSGPVSA